MVTIKFVIKIRCPFIISTFDKGSQKFGVGVDGFIHNNTSYIKESIFIDASNEMENTQEDTQLIYLQLKTPYIASDNGMTVTVHSIFKVESEGFDEYTISYEQVNNTTDKN